MTLQVMKLADLNAKLAKLKSIKTFQDKNRIAYVPYRDNDEEFKQRIPTLEIKYLNQDYGIYSFSFGMNHPDKGRGPNYLTFCMQYFPSCCALSLFTGFYCNDTLPDLVMDSLKLFFKSRICEELLGFVNKRIQVMMVKDRNSSQVTYESIYTYFVEHGTVNPREYHNINTGRTIVDMEVVIK